LSDLIGAYFDWVNARSRCSAAMVFQALVTAVKQDVEAAGQLLREARNHKVVLTCITDRNVITVTRERTDVADKPLTAARFTLVFSEITIDRDGTRQFSVIPFLNSNKECRLRANSEELELWQVCQRALEDLFFGN
jgi:hypothetical protein